MNEFRLCVGVLAVALFTSCKSGTAPPASGFLDIVVTPSNPIVAVGNTLQLTAKITGPPGIPQGVTWLSQNTDVATVSASGLITGISEGGAPVKVTWNEDPIEYRIVEVSVTAVPVGEERGMARLPILGPRK